MIICRPIFKILYFLGTNENKPGAKNKKRERERADLTMNNLEKN